jgi:Carboxypeptidase regulatory-like domain
MIRPHHVIVVIGAIALAGAAVPAQQPARDNAPTVTGTATISGRVFVAGTARQPARRARVTLTNVAHASPGQTTTTDDSGAFAFGRVPAGRFEVQAFKPGYLRASYGASRPDRTGTPIVIGDGQTVTDLSVTIARGGVITGIVRDPRGRPVPGVSVQVLKFGFHAVTGERTLAAPSPSSSTKTDDRGEYRAYELPPGNYLVLVNPNPVTARAGGPGVDDIRPLTRAEVQQAVQAARSGAPIASVTPSSSSPSSSSAHVNYVPVFHPGATDIGTATTIALGLSEERTGVDVAIALVPVSIVSGTISAPSRALPPSLRVTLARADAEAALLAGAGLRGVSASPRADGTFVFAGVAPGAYTVKATTTGGRATTADTPALWAAADVTVGGQDVDVPLSLQPGVTINGRVIFEGAQPTPAELQALSFRLVLLGSGGMVQSSGRGVAAVTANGRVNAQGRFTVTDVTPDAYQFVTQWSPSASDKWTIKSSVANGRESLDEPLRVYPDEPVDWTVTFTDTPTNLIGVLQDRGGRAATDYFIVICSSDRKYWTPGSRRVRMTRPATDGAFSAKGLPPGEYFIAALTDVEPGEWNDPALLEQLVAFAVKVTLREGEATTQDFRIGGLQN